MNTAAKHHRGSTAQAMSQHAAEAKISKTTQLKMRIKPYHRTIHAIEE
jgi:hypothetical protein